MNFWEYCANPYKIFVHFAAKGHFKWLSDEFYLKLFYKGKTGKKLECKNPKTFNEKIQWLKIHDRNALYIRLVDKNSVKEYVSNIIGKEYIIPTLGVWEKFSDIDFDSLPEKFVLKCTHDSGGIIFCRGKEDFNIQESEAIINKCLRKNYYWKSREWPYRNVIPRIIAEPYMVDESMQELKDYKFFTFGGKVKLIQVDYGRFTEHKRNIYTPDWTYIDMRIQYPTDKGCVIKKPDRLDEMIRLAEMLASDIPHVRVDFYYVNGKIYFGEMTFFHGAGFEKIEPSEWDDVMGNWINLPIEE